MPYDLTKERYYSVCNLNAVFQAFVSILHKEGLSAVRGQGACAPSGSETNIRVCMGSSSVGPRDSLMSFVIVPPQCSRRCYGPDKPVARESLFECLQQNSHFNL